MRAITALRAHGYAITADGDALRLHYAGEGAPDPATVGPLLDELRQHKAEALAYVRAEEAAPRPPLADVPTSAIVEELAERAAGEYAALHLAADAWLADPHNDALGQAYVSAAIAAGLPFYDDEGHERGALGWMAWAEAYLAGAAAPEPADDAPAPWDGATVPIADLPAFRAEHGLSIAGAEWLPGEPAPRLYVRPMSMDMGRGVEIAEPS